MIFKRGYDYWGKDNNDGRRFQTIFFCLNVSNLLGRCRKQYAVHLSLILLSHSMYSIKYEERKLSIHHNLQIILKNVDTTNDSYFYIPHHVRNFLVGMRISNSLEPVVHSSKGPFYCSLRFQPSAGARKKPPVGGLNF